MPTLAASPERFRAPRACGRPSRPCGAVVAVPACRRRSHGGLDLLGDYRDESGRAREIVALRGRADSLLVIDRDAASLGDRRLLAHLGSDEPVANATLLCRAYLADPHGRWCRPLRPEDLTAEPPSEITATSSAGSEATAVHGNGCIHRLRAVRGRRRTDDLRWCRLHGLDQWQPISLRQLIGTLESYEPVRAITAEAIAHHRDDPRLAVRQLRGEYRWLCTTPVVLNRALREAVVRALESEELSLSEIALRCGVVKRDRRGRCSGETSWLARRVGLMPEGGAEKITPWIHSDVLALIARKGLRVSPREVEVR